MSKITLKPQPNPNADCIVSVYYPPWEPAIEKAGSQGSWYQIAEAAGVAPEIARDVYAGIVARAQRSPSPFDRKHYTPKAVRRACMEAYDDLDEQELVVTHEKEAHGTSYDILHAERASAIAHAIADLGLADCYRCEKPVDVMRSIEAEVLFSTPDATDIEICMAAYRALPAFEQTMPAEQVAGCACYIDTQMLDHPSFEAEAQRRVGDEFQPHRCNRSRLLVEEIVALTYMAEQPWGVAPIVAEVCERYYEREVREWADAVEASGEVAVGLRPHVWEEDEQELRAAVATCCADVPQLITPVVRELKTRMAEKLGMWS